MGRDDRRSRCFGRRTDAESTGDAAGDTAVATTGVARTTAARCMTTDGVQKRLGREATSKKCIGTAPDLCGLFGVGLAKFVSGWRRTRE